MPYPAPGRPGPRFFHALNQRVSLVKLIPGLSPAYPSLCPGGERWGFGGEFRRGRRPGRGPGAVL